MPSVYGVPINQNFYGTMAANKAAQTSRMGGGVDTPEYAVIQQQERNDVGRRFSGLRSGLELNFHKRGIGRSGFAAESMSRLGAQQGSALADVQAGTTDALAEFQRQQREFAMMVKQQDRAEKKAKRKKQLSAGLGAAGLLLAPVTGGATLGLTASGIAGAF